MTVKTPLTLLCFVITFMGYVSTALPEDATPTIDPVRLDGVWFTCEFARRQSPPSDECVMLDDEGFSVSKGRVKYLRMQGSEETACKGGKKGQCFSSRLAQIRVTEQPVGKIRIENSQLFVRYMACTQKFHLADNINYVSVIPDDKRCFWATKRHFYVTPYKGRVTIQK